MRELELSPLKKLLYTLLKLSKKDLHKRFNQANIRITQLQYWVLVITKCQPLTLNEIARQFDIKPPSLIPSIDALETAGYLQRQNDPTDRRKIKLIITKSGLELIKKLPFNNKKDGLSTAFNKLSPTKQKELLNLLQELITHFSHQLV